MSLELVSEKPDRTDSEYIKLNNLNKSENLTRFYDQCSK